MDELMIKIDKVSKEYKLGQIGGTTLREELQRRRAKRRGLEDPTRKIGARQYKDGETFLALDGVSFTVRRGERVGIIGHNGAGKSTLLKLLCRVTAPTDGFIGLNGRVASMLEGGTGFHPELTGRENIYMNGAILGMTKKEIDRKIEDIIEFSEVRQFIDTPVKRYSSGMYVKLAFSVAAHLDSEIMIMDEVLAVGDMAFQKKCLDKMSDVSKTEGRTILYVSHNMNTIRQLCDRVIVLDHGHVIFDGGVEEGIAVYMGGDTHSKKDILVLPYMRTLDLHSGIQLTRFLTDCDEGVFPFGSNLVFSLCFQNTCDKECSCYLRVIIHAKNGDAVAMCHSLQPLIIGTGEVEISGLRLNISQIVPGEYYLDLVLIDAGELGAETRLEMVQSVYHFCIVDAPGFNMNKSWNTEGWGYINNGFIVQGGTSHDV